ncbi:hypothetical protein LHFGNBLO_006284 (plasmid) [Mesorhizobium sp. AR10]|uniref:hypothetical protein n=1 Tax=Mesorhizobium sp. AR10 TaxID=2865839 RepID=UPI00215EF957|nr:hypothetical protein [Mesorhizobium sp. AR10]UVK35508.1 hypothetical protein LHFGNBLO_006284 [Mesorhizobium sp. AR10]
MVQNFRLITTHDFFGSFAVVPTSYGSLPGGEALRATVNELRSGRSALWLDSGDFSQGGALTVATGGVGGLLAAQELGIDASVVGNHDLDFGSEFLHRHIEILGFPVLSANVELGLPATAMLSTDDGAVGIIGLTHHNLASMGSWSVRPDRLMPTTNEGKSFDVAGAAARLRQDGASIVVCVCHDGVDWSFVPTNQYLADPSAFFSRCRPWHDSVDLIIAGHTLGRFFGHLGKTPVVQPWPLGSELAIVDIEVSKGGMRLNTSSQLVSASGPQWGGHGSNVVHAAETEILGELGTPLFARSHGPAPLAAFLARAVYAASGGSEVAFAYTTCGQPTLDGVFSWLGAGPVSRLQLLQIVPYSDFSIVTAEVSREELDELRLLTMPRPQDRTTGWGSFGSPIRKAEAVRIAALSGAAEDLFSKLLNRELDWAETGGTLDAGVREVLAANII